MTAQVRALLIGCPSAACAPTPRVAVIHAYSRASFDAARSMAFDVVVVHQDVAWVPMASVVPAARAAWPGALLAMLVTEADASDLPLNVDAMWPPNALSSDILYLLLKRDITEKRAAQERLEVAQEALRRSEEQLVQAQKMEAIGRLCGGVAHDFNNMVTAISGYTELMLNRLPEDDPLRQDVEEIRNASSRAASLTKQLLTFSRRQMQAPRIILLNDVILNMERLLERLLGEDIDVTFELSPDLGNVYADISQLEQVLLNLAVNARDAMPDGGRLRIATENVILSSTAQLQGGQYVSLTFTDTGHGMDRETMSRIFEPFFTTKPNGEGTGLGLSTVYGIVNQSAGFVDVDSAPGKGACFKILLPLVIGPSENIESGRGGGGQRGTETILLVEDEELVRKMIQSILAGCGYQVLAAADADEALQVAAAFSKDIDLMLTDVVMPRVSGEELARQMGELRPATEVLYMSGYTDHNLMGATAFLQKPFKPAVLTRKIREVLDARGAGRGASRTSLR